MFLRAMNLLCKSCLLFGWAHFSLRSMSSSCCWAPSSLLIEGKFSYQRRHFRVFLFFFSSSPSRFSPRLVVSRMKWETYAMSCINYQAFLVELQKSWNTHREETEREALKVKWIRDFMKILSLPPFLRILWLSSCSNHSFYFPSLVLLTYFIAWHCIFCFEFS